MTHDTHTRSVVKALTWRVVATALTLGIAYSMTDNLDKAGGIALFAAALSTVLYYFHERAWNLVHWGRR